MDSSQYSASIDVKFSL